jgi:hypothetical protein
VALRSYTPELMFFACNIPRRRNTIYTERTSCRGRAYDISVSTNLFARGVDAQGMGAMYH